MRSLSDQIIISLPTVLSVIFLLLGGVPLHLTTFSLVPNVVWVATLVTATIYPAAWPLGVAFLLGLFQDLVFGTPLGAQALISVALVISARLQARRQQFQQFRIRWLEATGMLIVCHAALWLILDLVQGRPALKPMLIAGLVSAAWYPVFYVVFTGLLGMLPQTKVRH